MSKQKTFRVCIVATNIYNGCVVAADEEEAKEKAWDALAAGELENEADELPMLSVEEEEE